MIDWLTVQRNQTEGQRRHSVLEGTGAVTSCRRWPETCRLCGSDTESPGRKEDVSGREDALRAGTIDKYQRRWLTVGLRLRK